MPKSKKKSVKDLGDFLVRETSRKPHTPYAVVAIILLAIFFGFATLLPDLFTRAASIEIAQSDWSGGASIGDNSTTNLSSWSQYGSATNLNVSTPGQLELASNHLDGDLIEFTDSAVAGDHHYSQVIATSGGAIVIWLTNPDFANSIYAQKANSDGSVGGFGWNDTDGNNISGAATVPGVSGYNGTPKAVATSDGAIVVWEDGGGVKTQKITTNGTSGSAISGENWVDNGILVSANNNSENIGPKIVPTSDNGAIISWVDNTSSISARKINNDGSFDTGGDWGSGGITVESYPGIYNNSAWEVAPTSDGGFILVWLGVSGVPTGSIKATKVYSNGDIAWNNIPVADNGIGYGQTEKNYNTDINLAPISGGFVIAYNCQVSGVCAQRITEDGIAGGDTGGDVWGANGIALGDEEDNFEPLVVSSSGGVVVKFKDDGSLYNKISDNGVLLWGSEGIAIDDKDKQKEAMTSDGAGGIFSVGTNYYADDNGAHLAHINSSGVNDWDMVLANDQGYKGINSFFIINTGPGNAAVFWNGNKSDINDEYIPSAQMISETGGGYFASGSLVSSVFDIGELMDFDSFDWSANIPTSSSIEIETRTAENSPLNKSIGSTATASSSCPSMHINCPVPGTPDLAIDGSYSVNNSWIIYSETGPNVSEWLQVDLGEVTDIRKVVSNSEFTEAPPFILAPKAYTIETSSNGIDWDIQNTVSNNTTESILEHIFDPAVSARYVRILVTEMITEVDAGKYLVGIAEFEVYTGDWFCEWGSCPSTTFTSANGTSGSIDLSSLPFPSGQYFQYKITMATTSSTPTLTETATLGSSATPVAPPAPAPAYSPTAEDENIDEVIPSDQDLMQELYNRLKALEKRIEALEGAPTEPKEVEMIETVVPISQNTYIVQPRDYLLKIAQSVYGDVNRWYDLVLLNKDRHPEIANHPYLLNIGWELRY